MTTVTLWILNNIPDTDGDDKDYKSNNNHQRADHSHYHNNIGVVLSLGCHGGRASLDCGGYLKVCSSKSRHSFLTDDVALTWSIRYVDPGNT